MIALNVVLDGEGVLEGTPRELVVHVIDRITLTGLDGGMSSGKPSVAVIIPLPDGRKVLAETSLALLLTAVDALRARYGDPR